MTPEQPTAKRMHARRQKHKTAKDGGTSDATG